MTYHPDAPDASTSAAPASAMAAVPTVMDHASAAAADQVSPGADARNESPGRRRTLWMGELDNWVDETVLRDMWLQLGERVSVKIIRDRSSGANAGYGFVEFETPDAAAKAVQLNGTIMPNSTRPFRLNWASGAVGDRSRDNRSPEYSIFVGDLANDIDEEILVRLFQAKYSSVRSAKIMTDTNTNQSRGYGFVRFGDESEQIDALTQMQGVYCGSRPIRISTATPRGRSGFGNPAGHGPMASPGAMNMYSLGAPHMGYYSAPQPMNQFTDPNNTTVFVGGLSGYVTEDELRSFFVGFGDIAYVKIPPGKGCGFVQYQHRHSAENAINQMQGYPIGNSRVRLSWGRSQNNSGPAHAPYRPAPPPQPSVYAPMAMQPAVMPHAQMYSPFAPMNPYAVMHAPAMTTMGPMATPYAESPVTVADGGVVMANGHVAAGPFVPQMGVPGPNGVNGQVLSDRLDAQSRAHESVYHAA